MESITAVESEVFNAAQQEAEQLKVTARIEAARAERPIPQDKAAPAREPVPGKRNEDRLALITAMRTHRGKTRNELRQLTGQDINSVWQTLEKLQKLGWAERSGTGAATTFTLTAACPAEDVTAALATISRPERPAAVKKVKEPKAPKQSTLPRGFLVPEVHELENGAVVHVTCELAFVARKATGEVLVCGLDKTQLFNAAAAFLDEPETITKADAELQVAPATPPALRLLPQPPETPKPTQTIVAISEPVPANVVAARQRDEEERLAAVERANNALAWTEDRVRVLVRAACSALGQDKLVIDVVGMPGMAQLTEVDTKHARILVDTLGLEQLPRAEAEQKVVEAAVRIVFRKAHPKGDLKGTQHRKMLATAAQSILQG